MLFDTYARVYPRHSPIRPMPSQSVFCVLSMHFTATPHISPTALEFERCSYNRNPGLQPRHFPATLARRLRPPDTQ